MIKAKKEPVTHPQLDMQVFHEDVYDGREPMTIVGVRVDSVELRGDWSGGTSPEFGLGDQWMPLKGTFRLKKKCSEQLKHNGDDCQLPNVHCGFPNCEPYLNNWGHYVNGELVDQVEIQ